MNSRNPSPNALLGQSAERLAAFRTTSGLHKVFVDGLPSKDLPTAGAIVPQTANADSSPRSSRPRKGLTLFELLLALAIFMTSLAALAQLLASGSRAAAQAKLQTEAILRCESKLGEMVAGITPIETVANQVFVDDSQWSWRATVSDGPWPNLQMVELEVLRTGQNSLGNTSYMLRRYLRDPRLFVESDARRSASQPLPARTRRSRSNSSTKINNRAATSSASEDSDQ